MTLASTLELIHAARDGGYAIGAFNLIGSEHAQAIVRAAELEQAPVILQISQNSVHYNAGAIAPIGRFCYELACAASVPVGLHLDHATSWELCAAALDLGFDSVMFDASGQRYADNVRATAEAAERAHARGAAIEAELGVVGGKNGIVSLHSGETDPQQARQYVAETGVDTLAVAVGTSHAMLETTANVNQDLVSRLAASVPVPLVLHGSSGVSDANLSEAVRRGMVKINIATQLNKAFTRAVRERLAADESIVDPRHYLGPAREATIALVRTRIQLLGASNRCS